MKSRAPSKLHLRVIICVWIIGDFGINPCGSVILVGRDWSNGMPCMFAIQSTICLSFFLIQTSSTRELFPEIIMSLAKKRNLNFMPVVNKYDSGKRELIFLNCINTFFGGESRKIYLLIGLS